jgi:hypothetical protein
MSSEERKAGGSVDKMSYLIYTKMMKSQSRLLYITLVSSNNVDSFENSSTQESHFIYPFFSCDQKNRNGSVLHDGQSSRSSPSSSTYRVNRVEQSAEMTDDRQTIESKYCAAFFRSSALPSSSSVLARTEALIIGYTLATLLSIFFVHYDHRERLLNAPLRHIMFFSTLPDSRWMKTQPRHIYSGCLQMAVPITSYSIT